MQERTQKDKAAKIHFNRGFAYIRSRDYGQAIEALGRAIELNPEYARAYRSRGFSYARLQDYARAIEDYDRAIELKPKYAMDYCSRGNAYARLQDYARAIKDFERAIELWPWFAQAYYNAARVYALMGETCEACKWLEKAIGLADKYRQTAQDDEDFEAIREDERFKALTDMDECYEIVPGESIGPFKLGMTRDEIEGLNIRSMENFEDNTGARFPLLGVKVFYDPSGRCNEIEAELFNRSAPTFILAGHIVNDVTAGEAKRIFMSIAPDIKFSYAAFALPSAGLRAIKWEHSDSHIFVIEVRPRWAN
jgi:tetratricopeptide (TPR) repeat protein